MACMKNKERNIDCTSKKNKTRRVLLISFTIFVFVWIFVMSHKTARESETMSRRIDQLICDLFVDGFDGFPAEEQQRMLAELDFWVRKSAHFFEYAVLGAVLYLTAGVIAEKTDVRIKIAFFVGFLQAAADEMHQYFVEGRNPLAKDVLLDASGVCMGIVLVIFFTLLMNILRRYRVDRCRPDVKPGRGCIC